MGFDWMPWKKEKLKRWGGISLDKKKNGNWREKNYTQKLFQYLLEGFVCVILVAIKL